MRKFRPGKDFFAGLVYIAFGSAAVAIGRGYALGTAARMGPGYFPVLVGALLFIVGLVVAARGVFSKSERLKRLTIVPLATVLAAVLLFAVTIEQLGLVVAVLAVVVVGYLANARWRPLELALLAGVLTAASVLIFYYGLKLPFKVWPGTA